MYDLKCNNEHFLLETMDQVLEKVRSIDEEYKNKYPMMVSIYLTNRCCVELGIGNKDNLSMMLFTSSDPLEDTLQIWDRLCSWGNEGIVFNRQNDVSFESKRYNLVNFESALEELKWIASYGEVSEKFRWCSL